jgi:hypothetical protein
MRATLRSLLCSQVRCNFAFSRPDELSVSGQIEDREQDDMRSDQRLIPVDLT